MKHLIKDGKIVQSGMPDSFTRENGETFWGGYKQRTDIHYQDGWRDEVPPTFNALTQVLGERYYDEQNDVVKYHIYDNPEQPTIEQLKADKIREANLAQRDILRETDGYIIRRAETGKSVPQTILNERQAIRVRTTAIEAEIAALTTLQEVLEYQIHFNTTQS